MTHVQALLWAGVGGATATALLAGWRERARKRRVNLDAVGPVAWPTVQFLALVVLAICALLVLKL